MLGDGSLLLMLGHGVIGMDAVSQRTGAAQLAVNTIPVAGPEGYGIKSQ